MNIDIQPEKIISSAEITAYWRSQEPEISGDRLSQKMVNPASIPNINKFAKEVYPLGYRHLVVRHKFFYSHALQLLQSGKYDSCISLGSGFSLLLHYLTNENQGATQLFDTDIGVMVDERIKRLSHIQGNFSPATLSKVKVINFDVEHFARDNKNWKETFPLARTPLFIMEGLSYFLKKETLQYFFTSLNQFEDSSLIFDYWPDYSYQNEAFKKMLNIWDDSFTENIQNVTLSSAELDSLVGNKKITKDIELKEFEKQLVNNPILEKAIPARFCVIC